MNRLAFSQGHELAPHGGTAVAITPGWLRSEMMLEAFGTTEDDWRCAPQPAPPGFAVSETPRYVGRAVAALAADPERAPVEPAVGHARRDWPARTGSPTSTAPGPDVWRYELDGATDPAAYR